MDVLAHGLWGGAAFSGRGKKEFWTGFLVGMAPDLLSFGVFTSRGQIGSLAAWLVRFRARHRFRFCPSTFFTLTVSPTA